MRDGSAWVANRVKLSCTRDRPDRKGTLSATVYEYPLQLFVVPAARVRSKRAGRLRVTASKSAKVLVRAFPRAGRDPRIVAYHLGEGAAIADHTLLGHHEALAGLTDRGRVDFRRLLARLWDRVGGDPAVAAAMPEQPGAALRHLAYPFLRGRDSRDMAPVAGIPQVLACSDARAATVAAFGVRRARRDLVRAVATAAPAHIRIAVQVRTLVPVDHLAEYLRASTAVPSWRSEAGDLAPRPVNLRPLLEEVVPHRRRRMLLASLDAGRRGLRDTLRLWGELSSMTDGAARAAEIVANAKAWDALHDDLSRLHRRLQHADRTIEPTKLAAALDGVALGGGRLVAARSTHQLIEWGETVDNCISGYGQAAVAQRSLLFALEHGARVVGTIELDPEGRIVQAVGMRNAHLDAALLDELRQVVAAARVSAAAAHAIESTRRAA